MFVAEVKLTAGTAGLTIEVTAPVAAVCGVIMVFGPQLSVNSTMNLANGNGLVKMESGADIGSTADKQSSSEKPTISDTKKAVEEAQKKVGGSLPKGKPGKFGSPQRGDSRLGYRLDPPHPNKPIGDPEAGAHINWWDYSQGKRNGTNSGTIPIPFIK